MEFQTFLKYVHEAGQGSASAFKELKTTGYLEEGQGSMGGFTVPGEAYEQILDVALEESIVRPKAKIIRMTSDAITISRLVDTSHASSVLGGITASWGTAEGGTFSESNTAIG